MTEGQLKLCLRDPARGCVTVFFYAGDDPARVAAEAAERLELSYQEELRLAERVAGVQAQEAQAP